MVQDWLKSQRFALEWRGMGRGGDQRMVLSIEGELTRLKPGNEA
jgi:hypothetical protein